MSFTCNISPKLSWKEADQTPLIEYVEFSPNSTMHVNFFSFRSNIAPLYPDMCLDAPLSINLISSLVMIDSDSVETR